MRRNLIAAIDVGSHAIRMKIGEINRAGKFRELESFRKIAVIGHDTFTAEKVSFDSVDKLCGILDNFKKTMNDYGVRYYTAMATSAIREAKNRDYIVDQIQIKTGLDIEVIDNSQEQYLTLKAVKYDLEGYEQLTMEGAVIVVIGAGSIQVTSYHDGQLVSSQNVKLGALRIKEILGDMEGRMLKFNDILEEYVRVNMEGLVVKGQGFSYEHLIVVGGEMSVISQIIDYNPELDEHHGIRKKDIYHIFDELKDMDAEEIRHRYNIQRERAEIILPSLMLLKYFSEITGDKRIVVPNVSLVDGIVRHIHEDIYNLSLGDEATREVIHNAKVMAKQFHYNTDHCDYVEHIAVTLFDKLKKVHGLQWERQHLRLAAILHDIGKFISLDRHSFHSYELIRSLELFGMSSEDMEVIALVSKYHGMVTPGNISEEFAGLPKQKQLMTAKLISILRMADAMDRGHGQKIIIKSVRVKDKKLMIKGTSHVDTTLEEWNFEKKAQYFKEVFGIHPVLKITKEI